MNNLVNMIQNVKQNGSNLKNKSDVKQNNVKGDLKSISINRKSTNHSFKTTLNKVVNKSEDNKKNIDEKALEDKINGVLNKHDSNSKTEKKKAISIDMLLILLLQHMGDKVNLEDILNKLKEQGSDGEDITDDILKLVGNSEIDGINISDLSSLKSIQEKINEIIKALQKSSEKDDVLKDMLNKLSDLKNKDLDDNSVEKIFEDVTKSSDDNKSLDINKQIIDILKSKLLNDKTENNMDKSLKTSNNSLEANIESKITVSNVDTDETKNQSSDKNFEEDFLKNVASKDKNKSDGKIDRVTNFMADFNKVTNVKEGIEVESPISINKNNIVNDFIKSIKYMEQNNVKEMTVKVMPRELGEIVIRLTMENGLMKANITANNKEAYNLLNSKAQELNNTLGNGEIKIQNFTIDIYNGDTTFFSRENSKDQRNNSSNNAKQNSNGSISSIENIRENEDQKLDDSDSNVNAFV